jgi:hypothetical protein
VGDRPKAPPTATESILIAPSPQIIHFRRRIICFRKASAKLKFYGRVAFIYKDSRQKTLYEEIVPQIEVDAGEWRLLPISPTSPRAEGKLDSFGSGFILKR